MQRFSKVFTLMSAILALAFCAVACKTDDDDEPTMYTVTVSSSIEHGKVSVDKTSAEAGTTVKLTATADSGYELDSYSVKDASANELTVTDDTFTMPKSNVTVSATFKETAETVNQKAAAAVIAKISAIGTVAYTDESKEKIDDARAAYDALTEAQKELVPEETLALLTAAETKYSELKAAAEQQAPSATSYTVAIASGIANGTVTASPTSATAGTEITLTAEPASGYTFGSYSVTDANGAAVTVTDNKFSMPESNVTVSATFKATAVTPQKTAGSISYDTTSVSKTTADEAFTNTLTKTGDGTVTYASSKETVATVNEDGEVTIKGAGETTITATVADSDNYTYATKTASYTLTVTQASPLNINLKTGYAINSILKSLCADSGVYSCTKFARSNTNSDEATLYLDTEGKYIPVWSEGTEVYYYVPDGCTPVMNEDSSGMFYRCSKLTSLDVTGFDTSNVKNMSAMFDRCEELTSLDVSKFDTSNVTNMSDMFFRCSKLTSLDVDGFNTSKVTNMSSMFLHCSGLTSLDVTGFDTSIVTDMSVMFGGCSGLTSLDVTGFDTSSVTNMQEMFGSCSGLTSLDLSNFDTSKVSNMWGMFSDCKGLTIIYASDKFVTTSLPDDDENCKSMCFDSCSKLVGGAGTTYDSSRTSADYARIDGGNSAPGYFTLKLIGSKSKPDAVGDIVFSDGSATAYTSELTLTNEQKAAAIALIFYKGTGLNSGDDITTSRTLGVGLKHNTSGLAWCSDSAAAHNTNITTIQCPASESAGAWTFTGDRNGSDNLKQISDFLISFSETDDTGTAENYPAFYFGKNYKDTATNIAGTDYESGWYLPSIAELFQIYACRADTAKGFDIDAASEALGGDKFDYYNYWSSSQYDSDEICAYTCYFGGGDCYDDFKENVHDIIRVCAVREFN